MSKTPFFFTKPQFKIEVFTIAAKNYGRSSIIIVKNS